MYKKTCGNITYTQAGATCFVGQECGKFEFSSLQEVQWLKSLPAYS